MCDRIAAFDYIVIEKSKEKPEYTALKVHFVLKLRKLVTIYRRIGRHGQRGIYDCGGKDAGQAD